MIKYYLDGIECNPSNKDDIEYTFDFSDRRFRGLELSVDTLRFVLDDFTRIKTWQDTYGVFVAMPLDIVYSNGTIARYLLDFQDESYSETLRSIECKLKRYKATDNFFDNADGLSFGSISWQDSDFVFVDYVVIPEDQFIYFITVSFATFTVTREFINALKEVVEATTDLIKATVPVGIPPAPDWGAIIVMAIKLAFRITYLILITAALVKLIVEMINLIFPAIRQFKACGVKKLIEKGCSHLGYTLSSTLLDSLEHLIILPVPLKEKNPTLFQQLIQPLSLAYTNGYPSARDTTFLLGQLFSQVENAFFARTYVKNGIVQIENEAFFENSASNTVLESFNLQDEINNSSGTNKDEIFKRLFATYELDPTDVNTFDDTAKTVYEVSSEIINSPDPHLETIKNVDRISINFARGTRKGDLTFLENAVKTLAKAADSLTNGNMVSAINARKDVLQISSQYFSVSKLLWMNGTKLHSDQNQFIGCEAIVNNYHSGRFIQNNQKSTFESMPVAWTEDEFFAILNNNFVNLEGKTVEIIRGSWSERRAISFIDYTIKKVSTNEKTDVINAG